MTSDRWADRTVAVTGGLGFIGSHFVTELLAAGARVTCLYRTHKESVLRELPATGRLRLARVDLCDTDATRAAFREIGPHVDTIVHCAALHGNAEYKTRHAATILECDARMALNVLGWARDDGVPEVVLQSSSVVYSGHGPGPVGEDAGHRVAEADARNGYVLAHVFTETLADLFRHQFGMTIHVPRAANVYGPRDGFGPVASVIPGMIRRALAGEELEIWGDGSQTRSFVYVTDLVRATLQLVEADKYHTVNIGTEESVSIVDLARLVLSLTGRPDRVRVDPAKPAGGSGRTLELARMHDVISFSPLSLRDGLDRTIRWYRQTHRSPQ
ncbi:NAD-dependent epimerase/dehydratase family protein [Actinophytocola sp.]|jgi:dTDP-4-dehydro-6-deoxy-alpha-D-gulose 4-ketoreductase|uniref:NAD-dependent epimerase/dehydratase family protein n=1 Tax=Actinophytocola sp. TaxID=1872138 RepID=UPI002EDA36F6